MNEEVLTQLMTAQDWAAQREGQLLTAIEEVERTLSRFESFLPH